MYKFLEEDLRH